MSYKQYDIDNENHTVEFDLSEVFSLQDNMPFGMVIAQEQPTELENYKFAGVSPDGLEFSSAGKDNELVFPPIKINQTYQVISKDDSKFNDKYVIMPNRWEFKIDEKERDTDVGSWVVWFAYSLKN